MDIHPLRRACELRNLSIDYVAQKTGLGNRTILRAEQGHGTNPGTRQILCKFFDQSAEELGLLPRRNNALQIERQKDSMDRKRRDLLGWIALAGSTLPAPGLPDIDLERIAYAQNSSSLDQKVIKNLKTINGAYWNVYLAASNKSSVLDGVQGQLKTLIEFIKDAHSPEIRRALSALFCDLNLLTGEIYFDLQDQNTARSCYQFAAEAAREARSYDLWASSLIRQAFLPLYREDYSSALPLLQQAQYVAEKGNSHLPTRAWAAAVKAEAESGLHQADTCKQDLEIADSVVNLPTENIPAWVRFDGSRLPALRGACYTRLLEPDLAEPELNAALHLFQKPGRKRGMVLSDLATVSLMGNVDVEQSCNYIREVLDIISVGSSQFLVEEVRKLATQLRPYAHAVSVKSLNQRVTILV